MRPQSAKVTSGRQISRPKLVNNLVDVTEESYHNNRSNSQKGAVSRPFSSYLPKKVNLLPMQRPPVSTYSHQDSEKLSEDMRQIKLKFNDLKEENTKLRTKNMILEKERQKLERAIQEIQLHGLSNNRMMQKLGQDVNLVFTMKQQLKELRQELDLKEDEISKIKKALRYTKIQEVEMEKKGFADETVRLRSIVEQLVEQHQLQQGGNYQQGQLQNQIIEQNEMLIQMQQVNNELQQSIQELEYQNQQLTDMVKQKFDSKKNDMQVQSLKQEVQLRDREIASLKNQLQLLEKNNSSNGSKSMIRPQSGHPNRPQSGNSNNTNNNQSTNNLQLQNEIMQLRKQYESKCRENEVLRQDMAEIEYFLEANGLLQKNEIEDDQASSYRFQDKRNISEPQIEVESIQNDRNQFEEEKKRFKQEQMMKQQQIEKQLKNKSLKSKKEQENIVDLDILEQRQINNNQPFMDHESRGQSIQEESYQEEQIYEQQEQEQEQQDQYENEQQDHKEESQEAEQYQGEFEQIEEEQKDQLQEEQIEQNYEEDNFDEEEPQQMIPNQSRQLSQFESSRTPNMTNKKSDYFSDDPEIKKIEQSPLNHQPSVITLRHEELDDGQVSDGYY